jgi:hypothetical protein
MCDAVRAYEPQARVAQRPTKAPPVLQRRPLVLAPAPAPAVQSKPPPLMHSPMKPVSAFISKEQTQSEAAKRNLLSSLPAVWNAATKLTRVSVCLRCSLRGLDNEHEWGECSAIGQKELRWQEEHQVSDIREWAQDYLVPHIDEVPGDDTCCKVCLFARQDKRFHDLDGDKCLFPELVGQICYVAFYYAEVRELLCRLVGHPELAGEGEFLMKWATEAVGGDHRWLKGSTKVVWFALDIIQEKGRSR